MLQASSSRLAHWFDGERQSLTLRLHKLKDPKYLDARGRALHKRDVAAIKLQALVRGFLLRKRFFHQLELEANLLSLEVATEARLRWRRVAQAITDARPVRYMLQQLYVRMADTIMDVQTAPDAASGAGNSKHSGIVIASTPEERKESLCKSAVSLASDDCFRIETIAIVC